MENEAYKTIKIGRSTYDFYKSVSYTDGKTPRLMIYRSSPSMTKFKRKLIWSFALVNNDPKIDAVDNYIDWFIKKKQAREEELQQRYAEKNRNRNNRKVQITDKWIAVYNGLKIVGEKTVAVKGNWSTSSNGVCFHARDYGRQIPDEVRELEWIKVVNNTDSMSDYFDTDTMYINQTHELCKNIYECFLSLKS